MAGMLLRGLPRFLPVSSRLGNNLRCCNIMKVIPVVTQSCQSRLLSTTLLEDSDDSLVQFGGRHTVTVIPGDGVGPELVNCVKQIFKVTGVPVDWEEVHVSDLTYGSRYTLEDVKESLKRTGVGLKGALTTPSALSAQDDLSLNQRMK